MVHYVEIFWAVRVRVVFWVNRGGDDRVMWLLNYIGSLIVASILN